MMNKRLYRELCKVESSIPIFSKDWWLDAVCGSESWDVVLVKKGDEVAAAMPYYMNRRLGLKRISMPILTQTMGPWLKYPTNQKYSNRLSFENKIMNELIDNLPSFDMFMQDFHYSIVNWLPFYWRGFHQTTRYTYIMKDMTNLDEILCRFKDSARNKIKKARSQVTVATDLSLEEFYKINKMVFERQNIKIGYSYDFLAMTDKALDEHGARKIFFAVDSNGEIHSALYLIWDSNSSYVHLVGENPELRKSGAGILLIWEAMKFTKETLGLNCFDFEGSMIESVESVRRSCGGVQMPYFRITKTNSHYLRLKQFIREFKSSAI